VAYRAALDLTGNDVERAFLSSRITEMEAGAATTRRNAAN
jgi:predicted RNA polymerase sigma factor